MFRRLQSILQAENVEFDDPTLGKVVEKFFPDFRKTIGELQRLSISGKLENNVKMQE